jgi:hypothetical protein
VLVCKETEHGWIAGDELDVVSVPRLVSNDDWTGAVSFRNATKIGVRMGELPVVTNKTSGTLTYNVITPSKWKLKAYYKAG